mgnify:CR=1 FL=1
MLSFNLISYCYNLITSLRKGKNKTRARRLLKKLFDDLSYKTLEPYLEHSKLFFFKDFLAVVGDDAIILVRESKLWRDSLEVEFFPIVVDEVDEEYVKRLMGFKVKGVRIVVLREFPSAKDAINWLKEWVVERESSSLFRSYYLDHDYSKYAESKFIEIMKSVGLKREWVMNGYVEFSGVELKELGCFLVLSRKVRVVCNREEEVFELKPSLVIFR